MCCEKKKNPTAANINVIVDRGLPCAVVILAKPSLAIGEARNFVVLDRAQGRAKATLVPRRSSEKGMFKEGERPELEENYRFSKSGELGRETPTWSIDTIPKHWLG